jgi:hypothetical protein
MNAIARSLDEIAKDIHFTLDRMKKDFRRLGEFLLEARVLVPYGKWDDYIAENFPEIEKRQAYRYMQLAKDPTKTLADVTPHEAKSNKTVVKVVTRESQLIPMVTGPKTLGDLTKPDEEYVHAERIKHVIPEHAFDGPVAILKTGTRIHDFNAWMTHLAKHDIDNLPPEVKEFMYESLLKLEDTTQALKLRLRKPQLRSVDNV